MSNFRFGADDYKLNYYPPEASDGIGGVDWDKVESVEIEFDVYVKERTCRIEGRYGNQYCTCCGEMVGTWDSTSELYIDGNMVELWNYCPHCGARRVGE